MLAAKPVLDLTRRHIENACRLCCEIVFRGRRERRPQHGREPPARRARIVRCSFGRIFPHDLSMLVACSAITWRDRGGRERGGLVHQLASFLERLLLATARSSSVISAPRLPAALTISKSCLAGIDIRARHERTVTGLTPISRARSAAVGHMLKTLSMRCKMYCIVQHVNTPCIVRVARCIAWSRTND